MLSAVWNNFGGNAQHTGISGVAAQTMDSIHWQTSVDLQPGGFEHYGEPVFTPGNTAIVPIKTGFGSFKVEGINGATGAVLWSALTDYQEPPYTWLPPFQAVYDPVSNRAYFPGNGGTIFYVNNPDSASAVISGQRAFYGLANYQADPGDYNASVAIDTPLTIDASGDVYCGFMLTGSPVGSLTTGGIARFGADGSGSYVLANAAAGDGSITRAALGSAPAVSNDGATVYVAMNNANQTGAYLLGLDSTTLTTKYKVYLTDPRNGNSATVTNQSTSSPMVGPDGAVFFGVFGNPFNGSRGFLLHFSADLGHEYVPGAFGWDDTPSVIPTSMVPSYHGASSYLILSKYNNYVAAETGPEGGDGVNKIAVLDPYASQLDPNNDGSPNLQVMAQVLTVVSPTPDTEFNNNGYPNATREWCTNGTAVDPATDGVFINNEDGNAYRWNLGTNSLTQAVQLTNGIGEPYTPTAIGPDGTIYALNGGTLFALGGLPFSKFVVNVLGSTSATAGSSFLVTVQAADQLGYPITAYSGPSTFTATLSPADPLISPSLTGTLNSSGFGFFLETLKTAGAYTINVTAGSFTGSSATIMVTPAPASYFSVAAPPTTITGSPINVIVTARDLYGNVATGYSGTVRLMSTDTAAALGSNYTFTTGTGQDNGQHTFTVGLNTAGTQTIAVIDTTATRPTINGSSSPVATMDLQVTSLTPTADGFTVTFNKPFVAADLTLYGATGAAVDDVTLTGSGGVGNIHGTLLIDPSHQSFTFKTTAAYLSLLNSVHGGNVSVVLPDATYTVTLVSGTGGNGFLDGLLAGLDGQGNGGRANFVSTFTTHYQAQATPVLAIPDFARGPDSNTPIAVPTSNAGLAVTLYNAVNVTDVTFSLTYNPALLKILGTLSGAGSDASDPGATLTLVSDAGGVATFHYTDATGQSATPSAPLVLGDIKAVVPSGTGAAALTNYLGVERLQPGNIVINGNANTGAVSAGGVHVNAYFADVNGDKKIDGLDKLAADNVAQGHGSGFSAYPLLDPAIIGDVAGDFSVDAGDVSTIDAYVVQLNPTQIPVPPSQLPTNTPFVIGANISQPASVPVRVPNALIAATTPGQTQPSVTAPMAAALSAAPTPTEPLDTPANQDDVLLLSRRAERLAKARAKWAAKYRPAL